MKKTCKICKEKFEPKKSSLEPTCQKYDCKVSFALIQVQKQRDKQAKEQKMVRAKKKAVLKEKLKTLSEYKAEAKKSFQKWVRLRDKDLPCISCGTTTAKEWHGSHYFNANLFSGLVFDPRNCWKSCNYCNTYLSGNLIGYRMGLIKRHGVEFVEKLESEADSRRLYKYTKQELIGIKKKYDLLIKNFKTI